MHVAVFIDSLRSPAIYFCFLAMWIILYPDLSCFGCYMLQQRTLKIIIVSHNQYLLLFPFKVPHFFFPIVHHLFIFSIRKTANL